MTTKTARELGLEGLLVAAGAELKSQRDVAHAAIAIGEKLQRRIDWALELLERHDAGADAAGIDRVIDVLKGKADR